MAEGALNTATFMMTDIAEISRLWESMFDRMPTLLARYGARVAEVALRHGGSVVSFQGDRHAAVFNLNSEAIAAAVEIQRTLLSDPELSPVRARIAIHSGEVVFREREDYGPVMNRCARIREVAHGGQILVSEASVAFAPSDIGLRSLGRHRLRDLLRPEALFQVVAEGLLEEFPEPSSLNGSNIPIQQTTFVGREGDISVIADAMRRSRLLSLLGPGGVGKTRLAYQVAAESAYRFEGGTAVVELADVPANAAGAVAKSLGLGSPAMDPIERALAGLRERNMVLVMDNCEHLLEEMRSFVPAILAQCPGISILTTSRQALGVKGEERYDILPLTLPPERPETPAQVTESEAGRLFVDRAGEFLVLDENNMRAVAAICRQLDGLPLAIELAAARCDTLAPQEILDRLIHRFEVLARDPEASDRRHRTMQETIEWSNQLLVPAERTLLARLTAFRGGWTLESIEAALRISWDHLEDPFDILRSLVEKSLVFAEDTTGESIRYRLLETIREFAQGKMTPAETRAAATGLFSWASDFGAHASIGLEGTDQRRWFERVDVEWENLRFAIGYGLARPELRTRTLRLAVGLHRFWVVRGHFALGRAMLEPALDSGETLPDDLRAKATNLVGVLAMSQGDLDLATARLAESLALSRATGDIAAQGGTLCNLGMIAWERMDFPSARDAFQEASAILEAAGEGTKLGIALLNLGCVLIDMERLDEAREALRDCREPLQRGGSLGGLAFAEGNLGYLAIVRGDWKDALLHVRESLGAFGQIGDWKGTMNTLISAATLLAAANDPGSAATIRGTIEKMGSTAGSAPTPRDRRRIGDIDEALATADSRAIRNSRLKGLQMSPQDGVEYALAALAAAAPVGVSDGLDKRLP